jgi:hypothetical protein
VTPRHATRIIYGATIGLALVVALQAHPPTSAVMAGTLLATALVMALAELYSDVIGAEMRSARLRVPRRELARMGVDVVATGIGVGFPAVFFLLAAGGVLDTRTAFTVAKWSGLGLLSFYGFWAGRLAGAGPALACLHGLAVGSIGALLIALKSLLH